MASLTPAEANKAKFEETLELAQKVADKVEIKKPEELVKLKERITKDEKQLIRDINPDIEILNKSINPLEAKLRNIDSQIIRLRRNPNPTTSQISELSNFENEKITLSDTLRPLLAQREEFNEIISEIKAEAEVARKGLDDIDKKYNERMRERITEGPEDPEAKVETVTFNFARHSYKGKLETKSDDGKVVLDSRDIITEKGVATAREKGLLNRLFRRYERIMGRKEDDEKFSLYSSEKERTEESGIVRMLGKYMDAGDLKGPDPKKLVEKYGRGVESKKTSLLDFETGSPKFEEIEIKAYTSKRGLDFIVKESDEMAIGLGEAPENVGTFSTFAGNTAQFLLEEGRKKIDALITNGKKEDFAFVTSHQTVLESFLYKGIEKYHQDKIEKDATIRGVPFDAKEAKEKALKEADKLIALTGKNGGFAENQGFTVECVKTSGTPPDDWEIKINLEQIENFQPTEIILTPKMLRDMMAERDVFIAKLKAAHKKKENDDIAEKRLALKFGILGDSPKIGAIEGTVYAMQGWMQRYLPMPDVTVGLSSEGIFSRLWKKAGNYVDNLWIDRAENKASKLVEELGEMNSKKEDLDTEISSLEGDRSQKSNQRKLEKARAEIIYTIKKKQAQLQEYNAAKFEHQKNIVDRSNAVCSAISERIAPEVQKVEKVQMQIDRITRQISDSTEAMDLYNNQIGAIKQKITEAEIRGATKEARELKEQLNSANLAIKGLEKKLRTLNGGYTDAQARIERFKRPLYGWQRISDYYTDIAQTVITYDKTDISEAKSFRNAPIMDAAIPRANNTETKVEKIKLPDVNVKDYLTELNLLTQTDLGPKYVVNKGDIRGHGIYPWTRELDVAQLETAISEHFRRKKLSDPRVDNLFPLMRDRMREKIGDTKK